MSPMRDQKRRNSQRDARDDARYRAGLRAASGEVPEGRVDWEAFHTRLAARAAVPLARLRGDGGAADNDNHRSAPCVRAPAAQRLPTGRSHAARRTLAWWEYAARWSQVAIPVAIAVGVPLVAIIRSSPAAGRPTSVDAAARGRASESASDDGVRTAFEAVVVGHRHGGEVISTLLPATTDLFISSAAGTTAQ